MNNDNRVIRNSLKLLIIIIVVSTAISINSAPAAIYCASLDSNVIVEGILTSITGMATREIRYPSGYAIKGPIWIVAPSVPVTTTIIFLDSNNYLLEDFMHKKVHIEGKFFKVPAKKISQVSFVSAYDKIIVDSIYCIN